MEENTIKENALAIIRSIEERLEKGENNIQSIFIKTTMGPPIKVK
jgi:large subunit ribosomal protein L1